MPGDTNAEKNGFGLSYRTNAKTKIGFFSLRKKECYILFRGIPESSIVRQLERVKRHGKETDGCVSCLTYQ